jgi:hypothetical protein
MFNSPHVFAWVLSVFVRLQARRKLFLQRHGRVFLFFHVDVVQASSKEDEGGWWEGPGQAGQGQQLQNVRQDVVCGRGFPVVGKPFTTVLVSASFLEWSVDENLADRLLCFLKLQLLHVGLLIEKDPLQQGWFRRNPWGKLKRRMGSLVKQRFTYDTFNSFLLLLPLFQIRCQLPPSARSPEAAAIASCWAGGTWVLIGIGAPYPCTSALTLALALALALALGLGQKCIRAYLFILGLDDPSSID